MTASIVCPYRKVVPVEHFGLRQIPWKPIQNVSPTRIIFVEPLADPVKNVFVGREVPARDGLFDLKAKLRVHGRYGRE